MLRYNRDITITEKNGTMKCPLCKHRIWSHFYWSGRKLGTYYQNRIDTDCNTMDHGYLPCKCNYFVDCLIEEE